MQLQHPLKNGDPLLLSECHNIIQIRNTVMWDWHCFAKYSSHLVRLWGIFYRIISVPHNTITNLNNVIVKQSNGNLSNKLHAYLVSGFQINCVQYVRDSACHNKASFFAMSTVIFLSRFLGKVGQDPGVPSPTSYVLFCDLSVLLCSEKNCICHRFL